MADAIEGFDESVESAVSDLDAAIGVRRAFSGYPILTIIPVPFVFDLSQGRVEKDGVLVVSQFPNEVFRGSSLLLWGITYETRIHSLRVGLTEALCVHPIPVPGILYNCPGTVGETLDKIKFNQYTPAFWQEVFMHTASPAVRITLEISGPVTHAVLMGEGILECPK